MSEQSEPRRRRRDGGGTTSALAQGSAAKGLILVAVAVILGFLLIRDTVSETTSAVGADTNTSTDTDTDDPGTGSTTDSTAPETTAAAQTRPPAEIKVLVANGTDVAGAAGGVTETLNGLGYQTGDPTDAQQKPVDASTVYYQEGFQADAVAAAEALNLPAANVAVLPTTGLVENLQQANLVVVLGPDLASG